MTAPSHVWRVVTCYLCLGQVKFPSVHTCHVGITYIFCLSQARIVSDYQSYIAHHTALQEHNSITHPVMLQLANMKSTIWVFLEPSRPCLRQSIIRRFEELSPPSVFSIPRLGLHFLCMDQSLALSPGSAHQAGLASHGGCVALDQFWDPVSLLVLAGPLEALPGPDRSNNSPAHELTIMFEESENWSANNNKPLLHQIDHIWHQVR